MDPAFGAVLMIGAALVLVSALAIGQSRSKRRDDFEKKIKKSWGKVISKTYTPEAYKAIRTFSDKENERNREKNGCCIDDITWEDCDMDELFRRVDQTLSSPGEDVLYFWLRHPLTDEHAMIERERLIHRLEEEAPLREKLQSILSDVGRFPRTSYMEAIDAVRNAEETGVGIYRFAALFTVFTIILLFFSPVAAIILMVPDFIFNMALYIRGKSSVKKPILGMTAIRRILRGAQMLESVDDPLVADEAKLKAAVRAFSPYKKGAVFASAGASVGSGTGEVLIMYLNIFFHLDMLCYNQMIRAYREHIEELMDMFAILGSFDAAISAASYRASLQVHCSPSFTSDKTAKISFSDLAHPLLASPVTNSIGASSGNLITGANASGKSTFLKSVAMGAILAQSLGTVPAKTWQAPFFRVYTSMAIRDNLYEGESYFVVEIRSLARITQAMKDGDVPVLALIDEVLRGTNTVERIAASSRILVSCAKENSLVFAATHDGELTDILENVYTNWHFEGRVEDGDVHFDYRIKKGPTKKRNAIALLTLNGFSSELAREAMSDAEHFEETGEWRVI